LAVGDPVPRIAIGGGTVLQAFGTSVTVNRRDAEVTRFEVATPVTRLSISPDGSRALIYGEHARYVWLWEVEHGPRLLATATGSRDMFGCGFALVGGELLTLIAQGGILRGVGVDRLHRFSTNLRTPHSFDPRRFVSLPGGRLTLVGGFFSDPLDTAVTVAIEALRVNPNAVQDAIRQKLPISDRAVDLAVGPCPPDAAVVLRDPEDNEIPDDEEAAEELGDVENFAGIYIRQLPTARLVQRIPYRGRGGSGSGIVGTDRYVALEVPGNVDVLDRATCTLHSVRVTSCGKSVFLEKVSDERRTDDSGSKPLAAALDITSRELAVLTMTGVLIITPLKDILI
jgi:hypothetical protein